MNDKNLISQNELYDIMYNYIKYELDKCKEMGGHWGHGSQAVHFFWNLYYADGDCNHYIASCLRDDHWEIYNDREDIDMLNIKIYVDHVEFIEESKFTDFDKEFMRGLYLQIKSYVEGGNNDE